jgi:succinate dehydrogenase/fumarate reductase flavoprotein subunit
MKYDIVVIGSGITGMRAAIEAKELGANVALITKSSPISNNSFMAKGGINAAFGNMGDGDDVVAHIKETIKGSMGIGNKKAIRIFCEKAPDSIRDLVSYGVEFNRLPNGKLAQRPFGGSQYKRTVFAADETGPVIMKALYEVVKELEIDVIKNHFAINLLTKNNKIAGVTLLDNQTEQVIVCETKSIVLAGGGFASLYKNYTTNVGDSTGDSIAMGLRAGLNAMDMEFIQFHPTGLEGTNYLVSEAARGEGGRLINSDGEPFVDELNTRDFVTRAIVKEIQRGKKVFLDLTGVDEEVINTKLINLKKRVKSLKKIDITKEPIPINPLAHYTMGGVETDPIGKTNIEGLFVVGEAGNNGVNGANRLGGNSLSEGAVFGKLAGYEAVKFSYKTRQFVGVDYYKVAQDIELIEKLKNIKTHIDVKALRSELGELLFNKVGIIRNGYQLKKVIKTFDELEERIYTSNDEKESKVSEILELINGILISKAVAKSALKREESRGAHFRMDFPERDFKFEKHNLISLEEIKDSE